VRLTIRWKLLGTYLLLLLVMGGVLYAYLNRTLEKQLVDDIRTNLERETELAARLAVREIRDLRRDGPRLAASVSHALQVRATLIAPDGSVVGDSQVAASELATLENHRSRPEVAAALKGESASYIRYSTTVGSRMLYVAVPLPPESAAPGVLRLALPLAAVEQARSSLHESLAVAFALAALLAVGLSLLLTQISVRILRTLAEGAERFGAGDFRRKVPVDSDDELGELARVMNAMAERLQEQMDHLALERNRLDTILRGMGEGLLVADRAGTVRLLNPAFRKLFGVGDEGLGRPLQELSRHPALHATFRVVFASREEQVAELALHGDDGPVLLTHWVPLREAGEVVGVVAVFHDISDLKRLERVRRDFVANVSHELRTPVAVISGYAETLAGDLARREPETAARFAGVIRNHAERLSELIGDLLTLSELEAGKTAMQLVSTPLLPLVASCCALLEPKAAHKGIALDFSAVADIHVLAQRARIEQVLLNLLDNAVKYSPPKAAVRVRAVAAGGMARISLADHGPGIPPDALPRLFERFYRVDAGRSRDEGGTGLGLAIVKHIVQLHGGQVWVESTPGSGSTFHVELPLAPS
jgi:two-component system phosphate regulon sensor histidine kinase PhoR